MNTGLAWLYVALRIGLSLVQAMINVVMLRFAIFIAAPLVLLIMSIRAALIAFWRFQLRHYPAIVTAEIKRRIDEHAPPAHAG